MKKSFTTLSLIAAFAAAISVAGCHHDSRSAPQKAGDETKGAMKQTGKGLDKAANKTGDAAQKSGEAVHDATH